jgi:ubiquinol-cytochrome c reductase cytochrome b subunit
MSPRRAPDRPLEFLDARLGTNVVARKALRYVFPDHWSFMLGEVALYSFVVLIGTGVFLALFYEPSTTRVEYAGAYVPLQGVQVSHAFDSVMRLSFEVPGGLLLRQAHHWAALVFLVAIVMHLLRIFFTGAFRKPRELNWIIGLTMLSLAIFEGFLGYSLVDDLISGMGLAIAYSVAMSIPLIGGDLAHLLWAGQYPGGPELHPRLLTTHIFIVPAVLATLIGLHMALIVRQRHTQFPGPLKSERNVIGTPTWPGYALRSLGLMAMTAAVLFALGGLVQINPIWQWGPYEVYLGSNGAQPDWYLGWLIGALRLMPPIEPHVGGYTLAGNPFFGGVLFPTVVFGVLYAWPWLEQRFITRDLERHELLDRPRDNPRRTAFGAAFFAWVFLVFLAGAADRLFLATDIPYNTQVWIFRGAVFVVPVVAYVVVGRWARALAAADAHPLREWDGTRVAPTPEGGWAPVEEAAPRAAERD